MGKWGWGALGAWKSGNRWMGEPGGLGAEGPWGLGCWVLGGA